MTKNILITGPSLAPEADAVLKAAGYAPVYLPPYTEGEGLLNIVRDTQPAGILVRMGRVDDAIFAAAPDLRVISKHGVGVDNIDVDAATRRNIPVVVASGANSVSVAEHAFALLLAVAKKIVPLDRGMREGRWEKPGFQGRELAGSTIGLVAFGAIARQTARYAKAFGMQVIAYDPFCDDEVFLQEGVTRASDLQALLRDSDIVSLHSPLTPQTRHIINADSLAMMKPNAIIINTARGGLIDEAALLDALQSGRIAGAGLDSFAKEPTGSDHPFWAEPRLVVTPHIGGVTTAANLRVGVDAAQAIVDVLGGVDLPKSRIINHKNLSAAAPAAS
ncbi:hydroxyacid dehydrogenase [Paracoccus xiamenensis]|uniref:hydroxyacid dehydrogenase n=1 Tax=Paracoccus xiamenensis TaxID=2714901 RepID=UPI0014077F4E|nr:hydroxyacid dehydrogenase [Paracoccus xiamenensis]NHF74546.1 hydroxyacid dehydrogenase [Paracoccus xiamenensis]